MASPITVRLSETLEALLRDQAEQAEVGPSTFARQLLETALFAAVDRGGSDENVADRDRVLELLLVRVSLLEELLLTLVSKHVGGDRDERAKKVETYFARAEAHAAKKAERLLGGRKDGAQPGSAEPSIGPERRHPQGASDPAPSKAEARPRSRPPARRTRPPQAEGGERAARAKAGGAAWPTPGPARPGPSPSLIARVTGKDRA